MPTASRRRTARARRFARRGEDEAVEIIGGAYLPRQYPGKHLAYLGKAAYLAVCPRSV
jgi:hypothetical protein